MRPEESVFFLETFLISGQESVEVMEQYPVEDSPLRMSRAIHSCHSRRKDPRNGPTSPMNPDLPEKKGMSGSNSRYRPGKRQPALTLDPEKRDGPGQPKG
jgi:hypothetical protein